MSRAIGIAARRLARGEPAAQALGRIDDVPFGIGQPGPRFGPARAGDRTVRLVRVEAGDGRAAAELDAGDRHQHRRDQQRADAPAAASSAASCGGACRALWPAGSRSRSPPRRSRGAADWRRSGSAAADRAARRGRCRRRDSRCRSRARARHRRNTAGRTGGNRAGSRRRTSTRRSPPRCPTRGAGSRHTDRA